MWSIFFGISSKFKRFRSIVEDSGWSGIFVFKSRGQVPIPSQRIPFRIPSTLNESLDMYIQVQGDPSIYSKKACSSWMWMKARYISSSVVHYSKKARYISSSAVHFQSSGNPFRSPTTLDEFPSQLQSRFKAFLHYCEEVSVIVKLWIPSDVHSKFQTSIWKSLEIQGVPPRTLCRIDGMPFKLKRLPFKIPFSLQECSMDFLANSQERILKGIH